jgi:hypothetical protein
MEKNIEQKIVDKVKILSEEQQEKVLEFVEAIDITKKSIWDKLEDRLKNVPEEELAELPADASVNLDHYLYGSPKK